MNTRDPIASSTLAHLYVAQGHLRRAKAVLGEVLDKSPTDGHARVLVRRLAARSEATLAAASDDEGIEFRWQGLSSTRDVMLVTITVVDEGRTTTPRVDSTPCTRTAGRWRSNRSADSGTMTACLGRVVHGRGFVVLATCEPVSWGEFETSMDESR